VNPAWFLLGLFVIAAIGNRIKRGGRLRGFGLPSGSESLLVGLLLGPHGLGLVHTSDLQSFNPVVLSAVGWLAFIVGTRLAEPSSDLNPMRHDASPIFALLGAALAAATLAGVAAASYHSLGLIDQLTKSSRWVVGGTLGLILCGSAQQLVDWARQRYRASGKVTDALQSVSLGGDAFALLGMAPMVAIDLAGNSSPRHVIVVSLIPVVLGGLLGLVGRVLLRTENRVAESWALLLGGMLFIVGLTQRLGASIVTGAFVAGWVLGRGTSTHVREMRTMIAPAESSILLPVLVIAGATVDLRLTGKLVIVAGVAVLARMIAHVLLGPIVVGAAAGRLRGLYGAGLGFASSGEVAVIVAMAFATVHQGRMGQLVLVTGIAGALLGEIIAPPALKRTLWNVAEISAENRSSLPPPSPVPRGNP
jgi:Kef-type K+ transport system membrane component KefB